jgi:hypothetical protein
LKKIEKKMSWCSDAPEDESISLFAGLLAKPDMTLSLVYTGLRGRKGELRIETGIRGERLEGVRGECVCDLEDM